jgi:hypothetical protein
MTTAEQIRRSKRQLIEEFFTLNLGKCFPSAEMHAKFGSAFRTRVSEINRDPHSKIQIVNETSSTDRSVYWAKRRKGKPEQLELMEAVR